MFFIWEGRVGVGRVGSGAGSRDLTPPVKGLDQNLQTIFAKLNFELPRLVLVICSLWSSEFCVPGCPRSEVWALSFGGQAAESCSEDPMFSPRRRAQVGVVSAALVLFTSVSILIQGRPAPRPMEQHISSVLVGHDEHHQLVYQAPVFSFQP